VSESTEQPVVHWDVRDMPFPPNHPVQQVQYLSNQVNNLKQDITGLNRVVAGQDLHIRQLTGVIAKCRAFLDSIDIIEEHPGGHDRRHWGRCGAWLYPDDLIVGCSKGMFFEAKDALEAIPVKDSEPTPNDEQ